MSAEYQRVTLTKAERDTPEGGELIALLLDLSDDGQVTREEMERLREWLEVDRGIDFAACGLFYEVVDTIAADGEITEQELDRLALAIERVLPSEVGPCWTGWRRLCGRVSGIGAVTRYRLPL